MMNALKSLGFHGRMSSFRFKTRRFSSVEIIEEPRYTIVPTTGEARVFDDLIDCVKQNNLNTTVRVAGGWVRDRLLGLPSKDDIDIALDNISGRQFLDTLKTYYKNKGEDSMSSIGIVKINPEKSKHLETATAVLFDKFSLDFVHLRTEKYTETSRVPVIEVGSPFEDSHRRDLTINSLYYNLNTKEIEDFTGKGIHDLEHQIIQTPLEPLVTLTDDPLRLLRIIRFACRFKFRLHSDIIAACKQPEVLNNLIVKVSKERILAEMEGMFTQKPVPVLRSILLMQKYGILKHVFNCSNPEKISLPNGNWKSLKISHACRNESSDMGVLTMLLLTYFDTVHPPKSGNYLRALLKEINDGIEWNKLIPLSGLLLGTSELMIENEKGKLIQVNEHILHTNVKASNKDIEQVKSIHKGALAFHKILSELMAGQTFESLTRSDLGLAIRKVGERYELSVLLGLCLTMIENDLKYFPTTARMLVNVMNILNIKEDCFLGECKRKEISTYVRKLLTVTDYVLKAIKEEDLTRCYEMNPMLTGNVIMQMFKRAKGPVMSEIMAEQINWQLENPDGVEVELADYLKEKFHQYL